MRHKKKVLTSILEQSLQCTYLQKVWSNISAWNNSVSVRHSTKYLGFDFFRCSALQNTGNVAAAVTVIWG